MLPRQELQFTAKTVQLQWPASLVTACQPFAAMLLTLQLHWDPTPWNWELDWQFIPVQ